ncbi:hypothetical protein QL285_080038 [Trifolium repens]|nr:hypothetical protein QL285_080038 [Trifolium repens]
MEFACASLLSVREDGVRVREKRSKKWVSFCRFRVRERSSRVREGCASQGSVRENRENYKSQTSTLCLGSDLEDWKLSIEDFLPPTTRSEKVGRED